MTQFFSPGVYVQEVPSAVQPIAGVGTSTAGFIGVFATPASVPVASEQVGTGDGRTATFRLSRYPANTARDSFQINGAAPPQTAGLLNDPSRGAAYVTFTTPPAAGDPINVTYAIQVIERANEEAKSAGAPNTFTLNGYPVIEDNALTVKAIQQRTDIDVNTSDKGASIVFKNKVPAKDATIEIAYKVNKLAAQDTFTSDGTTNSYTLSRQPVDAGSVTVHESASITGAGLVNNKASHTAIVTISSLPNDQSGTPVQVYVDYRLPAALPPALAAPGEAKLCTSFNDFKRWFGDFSLDLGQRRLAHAVYGFFNNGGTRCYVTRIEKDGDITKALDAFETIDEIALVAAPGIADDNVWADITAHCERLGDRFAILDGPEQIEDGGAVDLPKLAHQLSGVVPPNTNYAAYYFPWLQVYDPFSADRIFVPPSGHMAGVYARVDTQRGVHKAPANEVVLGALGLRYPLSRNQQDGLNPQGINCIRDMNGNIRVWGARTLGGDANGEWKYINVRRLFLYLRESIDEGTQWVVFEPNDIALWAKITRNITAFLTNVWRAGALFGSTPQEAFYVKCDAGTNPPEVRDLGQVVTEIGVAVVRPAEFVIFRISQWAGPGQ